jgi:hypothetical protein
LVKLKLEFDGLITYLEIIGAEWKSLLLLLVLI